MWIENYEAFKNLAAGIQSIAVSLAVVIGGIWTLYTFSVLRTKKRAEADLFEQAVLDITVAAQQERLVNDGNLYIGIVANVVNKGNRNTLLDFRKRQAFTVSSVRFNDSGEGVTETLLQFNAGSSYLTLRRGASWQFPVLVRVPKKGFYMVEFCAVLSDEELEVHKATAKDSETQILWGGESYLSVC